jgi:gluconate 2-dehydrogenase gamma chain
MKRRESLKALVVGGVSAGTLLQACGGNDAKTTDNVEMAKRPAYDRFAEQAAHDEQLLGDTFFTPAEMAAITILVDIIIPEDEISGSASSVGVPGFIEFMAKDKPEFQVPLRGGLRWLDLQCLRRFEKSFAEAEAAQRITIVEEIAYPEKAKPEMQQGVHFFNLMRDLTASGFYTTQEGWKDIGYQGNKANQWDGAPQEILEQYGLNYSQRDLEESIKFDG